MALWRAASSVKCSRSLAADFFIRIHLKQNVPAHWNFEHAKGVHGVNKERDARFHVQHARPPQAALLLAQRHLRERAERPNRIGMRQHQDFAGVGFRAGQLELAAQVISEAAAGQSLHIGWLHPAGRPEDSRSGSRPAADRSETRILPTRE